jgi:peptide chain release factor 1
MDDEVPSLEAQLDQLEAEIVAMLVPKDPADAKDVILEVKAGEGGDESALFAGDLVRMYTRYAERQGWKTEVVSATEGELGGYKDISIAVKSRDPANPVYGRLKYEGGVHRVQRVPVTESQGRIHTSAAGVLVLPEAEDVDVTIDQNDLRIDVYRSSGPGGQSVNTTDSAVRITHVPTGVVVSMQNEKSQLQNKEAAMRVLRSRLLALALEEQAAKDAATRGAQIRTVDRSEKIRTYNWPDNRIADHRSGYKANNLMQVLDGDLDPVIQSMVDLDTEQRLKGENP